MCANGFATDSPLEETGFEPSVPLFRKGLSAVAQGDAGPISWMGPLSTGRLARRRWSAAGPLSTAVSFSAGPMVRIRFPPANSPSLARFLLPVSKSRHLPRPARARPRATAGRDAQGSSTSPQLPVTSLSGPFPVPQCRLGRFADRGRSGALSELEAPQDLAM